MPVVLFVFLCLLALAPAANAAPGEIDTSFGDAGTVLTNFGTAPGGPPAYDGTVLPDGRIVVLSGTKLLRFDADGTLDLSFSGDGIVELGSGFGSMDVYPDGRMILTGGTYASTSSVIRLLPDGSPDPSFGGGLGTVPTPFQATDIELTPDGGAALQLAESRQGQCTRAGCPTTFFTRVLKITAGGAYDTSFSGDGLTDGFEGYRAGLAVAADGKVVSAAGNALVRYLPDGTPDSGWGSAGVVRVSYANGLSVRAPVAAPDGSIITIGSSTNPAVRFTPTGAVDRLLPQAPVGIRPELVVLRPDGSILVGGSSAARAAILKYTPAGEPDLSFGEGDAVATTPIFEYFLPDMFGADRVVAIGEGPGGRLVGIADSGGKIGLAAWDSVGEPDPSIGPEGKASYAERIFSVDRPAVATIGDDGRALVGGSTSTTAGNQPRVRPALARYLPSGALDPAFADGGRLILDLGGFAAGEQAITAISPAPGGKTLALGVRYVTRDYLPVLQTVLLRLSADGALDPSFGGGDGLVLTDLDLGRSLWVDAEGRILVGEETRLQRFLPDGSKDPSFRVAEALSPLRGFRFFGPPGVILPAPSGGRIYLAAGNTIRRFLPNGDPDTSFGTGSSVVRLPALTRISDLRIEREGRLRALAIGDFRDFNIHALTAAGKVDRRFDGKSFVRPALEVSSPNEARFDSVGRVLVLGVGRLGAGIQRLMPDGRPDPAWQNASARHPSGTDAPVIGVGPQGDAIAVGPGAFPESGDFALTKYTGGGPPPALCGGRWSTIVGTSASDRIVGTPRRDVINGLRGRDTIRGLAGKDLICGGRGTDRLFGGPGEDRLIGSGLDRLFGGPGRDRPR